MVPTKSRVIQTLKETRYHRGGYLTSLLGRYNVHKRLFHTYLPIRCDYTKAPRHQGTEAARHHKITCLVPYSIFQPIRGQENPI